MSSTAWREDFAEWTDAEWEWFRHGAVQGGIPGLVRRVRWILDVSQRGLAALLDVSQSVVARWETGRTSPRAIVLHHLLRMAGLRVSFHDEETGAEVEPMRDDGARRHGGSRFPAHTDLRVTGWWIPSNVESTMYGTPDDHPSLQQLVAEAEHLDERREEGREQRRLSARPPVGVGRCA